MKILFITHYYQPDGGAASVRLTRLTQMLRARGHEVTVLTTMPHYPERRIREGYRGKFSTDEMRDGVRVVQVWLWTVPRESIALRLMSQISFMLTGFLRGVWLGKPDVIFIENQPVFTGLMGWAISKIKRTPYLANVSDFWPEQLLSAGVLHERHILYRIFRALVNRTQRDAHTIVSMHQGLHASIARRIGDVARHVVIMNAADLTRLHPDNDEGDFRARYGLDGRPIVSFIGTFANHMDYDTIFAILGRYAGREDVQFVLMGSGTKEALVTTRLEREQWTHVHHIGWLDAETIPYAWASSCVNFWALPDDALMRHVYSAKLFEAHAAGVPIVVCVEGDIADLLGRSGGGVAVPPGDVDGACRAIDAYLNDADLRAQHSRNARAYAEAHFDPVRVSDAYERLLLAMHDAPAS